MTKEMTIEMPADEVEKVEVEVEKTKKSLGEKVKGVGRKVKGGFKKVVDSKAFRITTGVVSTVAVGTVVAVLTGLVGGGDNSDELALPEDDTLELDSGDYEVSDLVDVSDSVEVEA